jgi:hypothetical protein
VRNSCSACCLEARSATELLEQEESILEQQLEAAVKEFVESRTKMAVDTTYTAALAVRE